MDITTIEFPESPMNYVCSQVKEAISDFINREATYIYSSYDKRKLFSLKDREDFVRNSTLSVDEYIIKHNLDYIYKSTEKQNKALKTAKTT